MSHNSSKHAHSSTSWGRGVGRRTRWLAAGVAGVAGMAAVSGLTGVPNLTGLARPNAAQAEARAGDGGPGKDADRPDDQGHGWTGQQEDKYGKDDKDDKYAKDDKGGKDDKGSKEDKGDTSDKVEKKDKEGDPTSVPCDADRLIAAIVRANATAGATLQLAENCTYTLTAAAETIKGSGADGLPIITQPVTLTGKDTSIVRAANAAPFRIFEVGPGGSLALTGLTVNGGQDTSGQGGGGIMVRAGGYLNVKDSSITHNSAVAPKKESDGKTGASDIGSPYGNSAGGAIANFGTTVVSHSTVSYNSAGVYGGGIYNTAFLRVDQDSTLAYNTAENGGGLASLYGSALLEKATISNNNAEYNGGGVWTEFASGSARQSTISENTAGDSGGGVANSGGQFRLESSTVSHNTANSAAVKAVSAGAGSADIKPVSPSGGGGVYNTGGALVVVDGAISDNTTRGNGGGIYNGSVGTTVLRNTEVSRNNAVGAGSQAGGIVNDLGQLALTGTEVVDNSATNSPGGIFNSGPGVTVDAESVIVRARPTNCVGGPATIPNCFG